MSAFFPLFVQSFSSFETTGVIDKIKENYVFLNGTQYLSVVINIVYPSTVTLADGIKKYFLEAGL